jgi:hypothetical protein
MTTILGNNETGQGKIPTANLTGIFNQAFESDDPTLGGCPALPPYNGSVV